MCKKICSRIATGVIVLALFMATIVSVWPQQSLTFVVLVSRFFDVMLPILAVSALIKYLLCSVCHYHQDSKTCKKD
ncbi:MAG: hypothetical protein LBL40_02150 [Coxiellaceae bacterium]|jgi:integral membrane sensor domain MASE1|nr:hypothetical protein [Coxiellaceae bacterium]